eukprot:4660871-Prymnesium_polylepis.1
MIAVRVEPPEVAAAMAECLAAQVSRPQLARRRERPVAVTVLCNFACHSCRHPLHRHPTASAHDGSTRRKRPLPVHAWTACLNRWCILQERHAAWHASPEMR